MATSSEPQISSIQITAICFTFTPELGTANDLFEHARTVFRDCKQAIEMPYLHGDRYRGFFEVAVNKKACAVIQFDPLIETNAAFRIELRPEIAGTDGLTAVRRCLLQLLGISYEEVLTNASVTLLTVAVSVTATRLDSLAITDTRVRKSAVFFDERGSIERMQLGSDSSSNSMCISQSDSDGGGIRVEAMVRLRSVRLSQLHEIENPFGGLSIAALDGPDVVRSDTWRMFLDACCRRGTVAALARLNDERRKKRFRYRLGSTVPNRNLTWFA